MDWSLVVSGSALMMLSLARFIAGVWLIAAALPYRGQPCMRIAASLLGLAVIYYALSLVFLAPTRNADGSIFFFAQLATYSLLLIALAGSCFFVYDTSIWTALFCCSAGYTVQNLASGSTELVWRFISTQSLAEGAFQIPSRFAIAAICTAAVYGATYLIITRPLLREGLSPTQDRSMIIMMAVVIILIIGFDLVIKWLESQDTQLVITTLLRLFHGAVCIFTLAMEFQLLINTRLEAERDTLEQVLAEHERQYEAARESVAAVNARMHDIRHSVIRLANDEGVGRDALREMLQEIEVYDSTIKTGNEALDTVLSEKRFLLARDGITLSCVADGAAFSFLPPADIYTLFSALIDGAAETGAPSISLVARDALGTASAHIECYADEVPGGMWAETADLVVKRHAGTFSARIDEGTLQINVLFPAR